ncbi:hypothetical protein LSTR_LSTR003511 [Laodelphax striatellus]|uniref:Uncharacterized protein n=1 Tax=Laodelphax striatellus TaxID=195883 RepID=A0A482X8G8_LAOST|nr:hypothetical protein LSTR_LSTR003511 [Laodelphax striatellus]
MQLSNNNSNNIKRSYIVPMSIIRSVFSSPSNLLKSSSSLLLDCRPILHLLVHQRPLPCPSTSATAAAAAARLSAMAAKRSSKRISRQKEVEIEFEEAGARIALAAAAAAAAVNIWCPYLFRSLLVIVIPLDILQVQPLSSCRLCNSGRLNHSHVP